MELASRLSAAGISGLEVLSEDSGIAFCRGWRDGDEGARDGVLAALPASEQPAPIILDRLTHEYSLRDELDSTWAARPLALMHDHGRALLVLDDPGGELLSGLLGTPMEAGRFLRLAVGIAAALGKVHQRALIHKDIKPTNILVNTATGDVRLTGFRIASRLPRERQPPDPPEFIGGTLAYMAPEQTGRMNRSIDSRSDLYSLGVTFYEMLTGSLPFSASDPMEWVHCHIARQARAPRERTNGIPDVLSSIVMKLLEKTAEDRYQTAAGIEADLRRCLKEWQSHGRIDPFPIGMHDASDRLLIAEELYGRETEIAVLLAAFDRVVTQGTSEFVLVSGHSGVGKSSLVNELHKVLVPPRGLFATGKFDQYKRDIPYATLAQALQSLIRQILVKSEAEVDQWRLALAERLGAHGQLIVNLVPELEVIIGKQPPVADLPPQDARNRFLIVFRHFLGAFATAEHPLALFLDDLQWLDAATRELLERLLTDPGTRYLLLIGAYRDNEVSSSHPLIRALAAIRDGGAKTQEIGLAPLTHGDLEQLIAASVRCEAALAKLLAQLVHEKTGGNPFFAIQFLQALADEALLIFDHVEARWFCDLDQIRAKGYADNIVELMAGKITSLPIGTLKFLQQFACLGNSADFPLLMVACGYSDEELRYELQEARRTELVVVSEGTCRFLHDRVQEAAYSLISETRRAQAHLDIGRRLAARIPPNKREEAIFEIVAQFDRCADLITSRDERVQVAEFYLIAGKRAKASAAPAAYAAALRYLVSGAALLDEDCWEHQHDLAFALTLNRAECEFLTGALTEADGRLDGLSPCAASAVEKASVACLHLDVCMTLGQADRAVAIALNYLRHVGIEWLPHPTDEDARHEYEQVRAYLGSRAIEDAIDLPLMSKPESLATVDVLMKVLPTAFFTDQNLLCLTICRAINLSLELGNCDASCHAYVWLAKIAGPRFGDYDAGFRFGQLGYDLVERRGLKRFQAGTYIVFSVVVLPWMSHVRACYDVVRRALAVANNNGDLTNAAYCGPNGNALLLFAGEPLSELLRETERSLEFAQAAQFSLVRDISIAQLAHTRTLRGMTPRFGRFDCELIEEAQFEAHFASHPAFVFAEFWYWILKLQARYLAGSYREALEASGKAQSLWRFMERTVVEAEYHFYSALTRAATCCSLEPEQYGPHMEALVAHQRQLDLWAKYCPENFENRTALVSAEIARIEGRDLDAMRLYETAIKSARKHGFVHNEALANELAGCFYAAGSYETIANAYLREARSCYLRWGADGKVMQLDQLYPHLVTPEGQRHATAAGSSTQYLDVASVVKSSQAVSSEIELPKLIERLMTIALENAGADRGLLILPLANEYLIHAEARAAGEHIEVTMRREPISQMVCPESLVRYVIRTRESVILDDASKPGLFSADAYLRDRQMKSILCFPLIKQRQLAGILFLENRLTSHAFTAARIAVLELLAAQAAISLENTRLYSDLQEREVKVRRLVDSNMIGILIGNRDGQIHEANQAFLHIVGFDQADVATGRLLRSELTPAEWHPRDAQALAEMATTGTCQPYEKEYFRKDGSRVPVLVGAATFGERGVVAFALDLTERKRAEAELAHANRVATMGQLTASISHEVNQPLAALLTNAQTAMRWLDRQPPNVERAEASIERIIDDGKRAADIVSRIRDFSKRAPARNESLAINEAILEVIALTRVAMSENDVQVRMQLAEGLPPVLSDKVQLQQVILNLIMNAIEAMSEVKEGSRELSISTANAESDGVLVAVSDTGPGLSETNRERIFEAFFTTKVSGLGMGLSICRSIINAHGGRLWAAPNEPHGTVFSFTLPISESHLNAG